VLYGCATDSIRVPNALIVDPSDATGINKTELKNQKLVVGAWRFELQTSCAQGRRATRLRYAPTVCAY
jgi:hypothetical protein